MVPCSSSVVWERRHGTRDVRRCPCPQIKVFDTSNSTARVFGLVCKGVDLHRLRQRETAIHWTCMGYARQWSLLDLDRFSDDSFELCGVSNCTCYFALLVKMDSFLFPASKNPTHAIRKLAKFEGIGETYSNYARTTVTQTFLHLSRRSEDKAKGPSSINCVMLNPLRPCVDGTANIPSD